MKHKFRNVKEATFLELKKKEIHSSPHLLFGVSSGPDDPGGEQVRLGGWACGGEGAGPEPGQTVEPLCLFRVLCEVKDQRPRCEYTQKHLGQKKKAGRFIHDAGVKELSFAVLHLC